MKKQTTLPYWDSVHALDDLAAFAWKEFDKEKKKSKPNRRKLAHWKGVCAGIFGARRELQPLGLGIAYSLEAFNEIFPK